MDVSLRLTRQDAQRTTPLETALTLHWFPCVQWGVSQEGATADFEQRTTTSKVSPIKAVPVAVLSQV